MEEVSYLKKIFLGLALVAGILAGCAGGNEQEKSGNTKPLEPIDVIIVTPDKIDPNKEVEIKAEVTQGKDKVDDAKEVKFEIWKNGTENHTMTPGKNEGKGVYSAAYTFKESGTYSITSHVTARDMHSMPTKQVTVGMTSGEEAEHHDDHDHHSDTGISIVLEGNKVFPLNKEVTMTALIKQKDVPLTGANITFEVWRGEEQKHEWVDAKELGDGKYSINKTFSSTGMFHVQVHVKKGELHEHNVIMFDVK